MAIVKSVTGGSHYVDGIGFVSVTGDELDPKHPEIARQIKKGALTIESALEPIVDAAEVVDDGGDFDDKKKKR